MSLWFITFVLSSIMRNYNYIKSQKFELQIFNCQAEHLRVRKECIEYMKKNKERFEAVKYERTLKIQSCL